MDQTYVGCREVNPSPNIFSVELIDLLTQLFAEIFDVFFFTFVEMLTIYQIINGDPLETG